MKSLKHLVLAIFSVFFLSCADTIPTTENRPIVSAGDDQAVTLGDLVVLDGSVSYDPKGRSLSFSWAFTGLPTASTTAQSSVRYLNGNNSIIEFTPDVTGSYVLGLTASNGESSDTDYVVITVT